MFAGQHLKLCGANKSIFQSDLKLAIFNLLVNQMTISDHTKKVVMILGSS